MQYTSYREIPQNIDDTEMSNLMGQVESLSFHTAFSIMLVLEVKMIGFYDSGHEAYKVEGNEELNNI